MAGGSMMMAGRRTFLSVLVSGVLVLGGAEVLAEEVRTFAARQFSVTFDKEARNEPFTGRVVLYFSKSRPEPRKNLNWFNPEILVGRDVVNWEPGMPLVIDTSKPDELITYPKPVNQLDLGGWKVQAVARFNSWEREVGEGEGNGYSETVSVPEETRSEPIELVITKLIEGPKFPENQWCKLLKVKSGLLSKFYGRDVFMNAAVLLPASYSDQEERRYPVMFQIPGFGGTHLQGFRPEPVKEQNEKGVEFIRVMLDASCPLGHHVFADSENNGPCGAALIQEFLPELDRSYRTDGRPEGRFLTGHSSGGWSSLWLMVTYPEHFAGTWSTSPDPVCFENFQYINLYAAGENAYLDRVGERRPLARRGKTPFLFYRDFDLMEQTLGSGGQLHSFEAAFSPRGADGRPRLAWDRKTGVVDTAVTKMWEKYDIKLILERNWETLGPKLKGKLHVHMGDLDTFYLEGATQLLAESMKKLDPEAVVEMHPGKDHGTIMTPVLISRMRSEMVQKWLSASPEGGK